CNVLLTACEAAFENLFSVLKSNRWVGDFQVATSGGFWVATRDFSETCRTTGIIDALRIMWDIQLNNSRYRICKVWQIILFFSNNARN
ncbi:MAG: hypothetical protein ABFD06_11955, partial [Smithella sp.]